MDNSKFDFVIKGSITCKESDIEEAALHIGIEANGTKYFEHENGFSYQIVLDSTTHYVKNDPERNPNNCNNCEEYYIEAIQLDNRRVELQDQVIALMIHFSLNQEDVDQIVKNEQNGSKTS